MSVASSSGRPATRPSFQSLPNHLLLKIVQLTIPKRTPRTSHDHVESLCWLTQSLRLVSRATYIVCMNFLRSHFLQDYMLNVKPPYTCDPFPLEPPEANLPPQYQQPQSVRTLQRETPVLDQFIVLKCYEDRRSHESELYLDLDSFKDIFELMQPKARTEDLIRRYGMRAGVVSLSAPPLSPSTPTSRLPTPLPFSEINVSFSPRRVGVVILRRTVVAVPRERDESLENIAKRLIMELARLLGRSGG
ncbi:hypothetical protein FRB99_003066 [Tulasnella sp. 403]|nr:hypothetical protein FRB99_003066 [Tulasnella sp. 403]